MSNFQNFIGTPCTTNYNQLYQLHTSILDIFYSDTLYVATYQYPATLQHVLVVIMLETDHQRRPATHLRPEQIIHFNILDSNKTKYFRLRLTDEAERESLKRHETNMRQT